MADPTVAIEQAIRATIDPTQYAAHLSRSVAGTLNDGLPGTALLLATLSTTDHTLARAAERHWEAAAPLLTNSPPDGIYRGPGALAASLIIGSAYLPSTPTRRALDHATAWLAARAQGLARHQQRRRAAGHLGTPWGVYDVIKGLAGIGRILLTAIRTRDSVAQQGLDAALTTLTDMINTPADLPGWWLPAEEHVLPVPGTLPASGAATTGMAHGIAGPLALLSLATRAGHTVPGQRTAIRSAAAWLLRWSTPGPAWPPNISGEALRNVPNTAGLAPSPGRRDAWCYGTPGIATALIHAARALDDDELHHTAHAAMDVLARRSADSWDSTGPGLCHGSAGVLQAAHRTGHAELARHAALRTARLLLAAESRTAGYLTGTAGATLALADHHGLLPAPPGAAWDAPLVLQ
ncbi:lanthionine synthetase C family protein [Streptomyces millisiae]|uniref:Lanthionine synthetase C family protein n=1 Tax=Streptomyces millisiae TaxID=3075542 RepID=A0ABU2LZ63_9ACTN|nr:lanthionine synthetase C family protein [Streptomyces sp. DSM 44918]MDT0322877.1 lanthionine synthetase C family protein [Streptomyces sp. DSM 44918]